MLLLGKTDSTTVNGPGERCGVWFQGCTLNCEGCWSPHSHPFDMSKKVSISAITDWILSLPIDLEGITFSGGDPVQHILYTLVIAKFVRNYRPGWSIGMFTGYSYKEVKAGKFKAFKDVKSGSFVDGKVSWWDSLEGLLDFAVMGRYNKLLPTNISSSPLVTTSNQELKLFSNRYSLEDFTQQAVEIIIDADSITTTGFPVGVDLTDFS